MPRLGQFIFVLLFCFIDLTVAGWRSNRRNETKFHKYVAVKCESLDEKVLKVEKCKLAEGGGVELTIDVLQPLTEIFVSIASSMKSGNESFRNLFKSPDLDFCAFMAGASTSPLFTSLISQLKVEANTFHKCPYEGRIETKNMDLKDDKFFSVYLTGLYRSVAIISTKGKSGVLSLTFDAQITTPIKMG